MTYDIDYTERELNFIQKLDEKDFNTLTSILGRFVPKVVPQEVVLDTTPFQSTKSQSYSSFTSMRLTAIREQILKVLKEQGPLTRIQISEQTGLRLSTVCGQVPVMMLHNYIEVYGRMTNPTSGKPNEILTLTNGVKNVA